MSMRAFVITGPGKAEVLDVEEPAAAPGEVVVDVDRAGVCGTDMEVFTGEMAYLHTGEAEYPVRIGHEWCGVVTETGDGVDPSWVGRRVTGDTMLGCGHCARCTSGRQHLCADRFEIGIRGGRPGALAARLPVPVRALHELPASVDATLGALVEPGGNALRAVLAAGLSPGSRVLITGPGTIGLLAAQFAHAAGAEVHLLGLHLDFARSLGFGNAWTADELPDLPFDAVIDCSNAAGLPARAVDLVEPGGRVVFIGIAGEPSLVDSRRIALKDLTVVGVLSASPGLAETIARYASGAVDPRPLVAATVGLDDAVAVLAGERDPAWGAAPKIHIDPRR
jgi:threonine dehydrogenase-like Zn-dependent dehydrogenase